MKKIEYPVFAEVDEVYYGITENSTTKITWYPAVEVITSNRSVVDENILKNKCTKELFAHAVSVASERIRHNPYPKLHDEEWVKKRAIYENKGDHKSNNSAWKDGKTVAVWPDTMIDFKKFIDWKKANSK